MGLPKGPGELPCCLGCTDQGPRQRGRGALGVYMSMKNSQFSRIMRLFRRMLSWVCAVHGSGPFSQIVFSFQVSSWNLEVVVFRKGISSH